MQIDSKAIETKIVQEVADRLIEEREVYSAVSNEINTRIDKMFSSRIDGLLNDEITKMVSEGFNREYQKVDSFGDKKGPKTTIRSELEHLITGYWSQRVDQYGKPTTSSYGDPLTRAEYMMAQICAKDFSAQMKSAAVNVTAELKDGLRAQLGKHVDGLLDGLFHVKSIQDQGKAEKPW